MSRAIYLDGNDWESRAALTRRNTETGVIEAATGLSLTVWLAATRKGSAIHADLQKSMTERTNLPASYYAVFDGTDLVTHLTNLPGVWEVVGDGVNARVREYHPVRSVRPPDG